MLTLAYNQNSLMSTTIYRLTLNVYKLPAHVHARLAVLTLLDIYC